LDNKFLSLQFLEEIFVLKKIDVCLGSGFLLQLLNKNSSIFVKEIFFEDQIPKKPTAGGQAMLKHLFYFEHRS
jgi:hypothetical protein